jgi:hypothetical protein
MGSCAGLRSLPRIPTSRKRNAAMFRKEHKSADVFEVSDRSRVLFAAWRSAGHSLAQPRSARSAFKMTAMSIPS